MVSNLFKLYAIFFVLMLGKDIVLPNKSWVKGMVVESNSEVCVIQPIDGPPVIAAAYYYCPKGHMVSAQTMVSEDATEYDSGLQIVNLTVLIGL